MNDIVSPLQSISYTNKDFVSVYEELLDLTKQLTSLWDPSISNESDPGVILLKLNAVIADKCNYSIDKSILECFPLSVTQEANARQLFEQLGYYMHWYRAATTEVYIKWIGDPVLNQTITIPKFTMVTDDNASVIYTLLGTTQSSSTGTYNISDQTISCSGNDEAVFTAIQGLAVNYDVNGNTLITVANLDSNNRLYFPTTDVAENGIFIRNVSQENYTSWHKVDNLVAENTGNSVYKFGVTRDGSSCYIEFPDDVNQLFNEGIYITYIRTNGNQGNISSQYISKFYNFNTVIQGDTTINIDSSNVFVTNYSSAVDGKDTQGINDAYRSYQRTVGTFKTLVTLRDYINYINNSGLVSNGFVCDRSNDIQETYRILSSVNDIDQTINITDDNISAFSLKLYLLNYVEEVNIGNYVSTFKMLNNNEQSTIRNYVYDTQTINHEFLDTLDPTPTSANICFFKNKCPIECTIIAQSVLTAAQTNEMKSNIINALYQQFNSKEINFGDKFPYDLVYKTILESDSRIKNVSLGNIDYTTYAVYQDSTRTLTYSSTSAAWYDDEWNIDKPSNYGIIVANPVDGAIIHLPTTYKEVNINDDTDIVYFCCNDKNITLDFNSQSYITLLGPINVYDKKWFKYESSKWNVYSYDYENKEWEQEASDVTLASYGITLTGTITEGTEFKIRLSYAHQFRNDIYVKSVLAGITQFFMKDEKFDYRLNFNYRNQVDDVEKLWSNVDIVFESNDLNFPESEYVLKPNESLQFYAPNLLEKNTYTGNVKFEYQLNNTVTQGSNYQLSSNEYIIFYWKESTDYNYKYHSYGEGTIINPSIELDPNEIPGNNIADIQEYHLLNYVEVSPGTYAYGEKSSDIYGDISARANAAIDTIASANNRLTSSSNIKIKQLSQFDISSSSNYGIYWVLNYEDNGKYVLFTENQTSRILNINEMFIFTNPSFTSYTVLGAGTEISRNTIGDIWQVDAVDASTILNDGIEALKDVFFKIPVAATLTATENIFTTFSNETKIRIAPNSDSVYTYQVDATSNITVTSFDADFWNTSNVGKINNVEIRYQNDVSHPWKIYVDSSTSYDVSSAELLSAYGVQLDATSATTSDKVTVLYYLDYQLKFDRELCDITLPEGENIYRTGSGQISLSQFSIRYKTKDSEEFNSLDDLLLTNQAGWRARSLLAIDISSVVYQILYENQSIKYKLLNDDTDYSINGKNSTLEDYENNIPASYPVCLMSSFGVSSDGGDIIDTHLSSYNSDGTIEKTYLSLYEFKKLQDLPEVINLSNDRKFVFTDDGDINFSFTSLAHDRSIHIALPIGEYVVAVKNNQDNLSNVSLSLDGTSLNQMYNYTDASTHDISDQGVYYMYLPIDSVYTNSMNISTTMTSQTVTTTSTYGTNYGDGTYIFKVAYNSDQTKYILIDSYGNQLVPENIISNASKDDYQSFGIQLSRAIDSNNNDIGKVIIVSNEHILNLHIEGQEYDCMLQVSNCYKYTFPERFSQDNISFIQSWISYLDENHFYKYNHEVPQSVLIMNPVDSTEFFNTNHIYNKFTIGQLDKIRIK